MLSGRGSGCSGGEGILASEEGRARCGVEGGMSKHENRMERREIVCERSCRWVWLVQWTRKEEGMLVSPLFQDVFADLQF